VAWSIYMHPPHLHNTSS